MKKQIEMVRAFNIKFGLPLRDSPGEMHASVASLRKKLTLEEAQELADAIDRGELHEQLDAICDDIYVAIGTAIALGFGDVLEEAFNRVHQANMAKVLAQSRQESKRDNRWDLVKPAGWAKPVLTDLVRPAQDKIRCCDCRLPVTTVNSICDRCGGFKS